jgi:hypothetical protein
MTTLSSATLDLSKILQHTAEGTATGGTLTTLLDTTRTEADDHFNNGTIWFRSGTASGASRVITDYAQSGGVFTFSTTGMSSGYVGILYSAAAEDYPRWLLVQAINEAMREMFVETRTVALTVKVALADSTEFTLPTGVYNVKKVEISSAIVDPYGYIPSYHWNEVSGKIVFDYGFEPEEGVYLRITYHPAPTALTTDTDTINSTIPINTLIWHAAVYALRWKIINERNDYPERKEMMNEALQTAVNMAAKYPVPRQARDPHLALW